MGASFPERSYLAGGRALTVLCDAVGRSLGNVRFGRGIIRNMVPFIRN